MLFLSYFIEDACADPLEEIPRRTGWELPTILTKNVYNPSFAVQMYINYCTFIVRSLCCLSY